MGYKEALVAAGATVTDFASFGSWQGDWFAVCEVAGERRLVHGWFGSCTGCDAFEAEFGLSDEETAGFAAKLAAFGKRYLDNHENPLELRDKFVADALWDYDAAACAQWLTETFALPPAEPVA